MLLFINFIPIIVFVILFVGSGIYFSLLNINNAFYQVSPITCIIPGIMLGWIIHPGKTNEKMNDFLDGIRHKDIITMCLIFLLAGAFTEITKNIGSIEATVNFAISCIPEKFILVGLFIVAAFVSTSIGTSMGTIATVGPIAALIATHMNLSSALTMATVVGGAMFGDNLSIISDTTIASVMSQQANSKDKLRLNMKIALMSGLITAIILFFSVGDNHEMIQNGEYRIILISPYILLLILSILGVNVFISLVFSIIVAAIIGFFTQANYSILVFSKALNQGFASMNEIMLLSLLVGGLSGLCVKNLSKNIVQYLSHWMDNKNAGIRIGQLAIAKIVSVFDILLANNTIAIIFSGEIARDIAKKYKIPPHYSAVWLDIFSCIFQGIIPHGAQILLASAIANVSPLEIIPYVYYCFVLFIISVSYILFNRNITES